MDRAALAKRRAAERDVINIDDDSSDEQPAVKIKAMQIPSAEVLELQNKVVQLEQANAKLEKNFQGACRIAGEAQARVQFLENLIDTKPKVIDGVKNMERENELEKKIDELTRHLGQFEHWADQVQRIPGFLGPPKPQFPSEPLDNVTVDAESEVVYDGAKKKKRVDELEENMDYMLNQVEEEGATVIPPILYETVHPTNLFQLYHPDTPDTISVAEARSQLKSLILLKGGDVVFFKHKKRCNAGSYEDLECTVCQKMLPCYEVIPHFISKAHKNQVPRGATVSLAAFERWSLLLQPTPGAAAARTSRLDVAAALRVGGAIKEVEKE